MRRSAAVLAAAVLAAACALLAAPGVAGAVSRWPDLSEPPSRQGGGKKDAAVVIGVADYADLPAIPGADDNARDWAQWLRRTRGVPSSSVKLLVSREATDIEIRNAVKDAAKKVKSGGTLWIVFIGHGAPTRDGKDGVLVGYDARQEADTLYARSVTRSEVLAAAGKGRQSRTVFVVDACFSGQASGTGGTLVTDMVTVPVSLPPVKSRKVVTLTAGGPNEFAGPLPGAARPAFSYLLLGALRGWADQDPDSGNSDGRVTIPEAMDYVSGAISTAIKGRSQHPALSGQARDLILARGAREEGPDIPDLLDRLSRERSEPVEGRDDFARPRGGGGGGDGVDIGCTGAVERRRVPIDWLWITGTVLTSVTWLATIGVTAGVSDPSTAGMTTGLAAVPILGPWLMFTQPLQDSYKGLIVGSGVLQLVGLGMIIGGAVGTTEEVCVSGRLGCADAGFRVAVVPIVAPGGWIGVGVAGAGF